MKRKHVDALETLTADELNGLERYDIQQYVSTDAQRRIKWDFKKKAGFITTRAGKRSKKRMVVFAAVICILSTSAFAFVLNGSHFLNELFGGKNYKLIENYIYEGIAVEEDENLRITVESALSDGYATYAVISLERLDGESMDNLSPDVVFTMSGKPDTLPAYRMFSPLNSKEDTASKRYYLFYDQSGFANEELHVSFAGLREGSETVLACSLTATVSVMPCPVMSGTLKAASGDPYREQFVGQVILSPFGLQVDIYDNKNYVADTDGSSRMFANQTRADELLYDGIYIKYKNGRTVGTDADTLGRKVNDGTKLSELGWTVWRVLMPTRYYTISIQFDDFIELQDVSEIIINDMTYALETTGVFEAGTIAPKRMETQYEEWYSFFYGSHILETPDDLSTSFGNINISVESIMRSGTATLFIARIEDAFGNQAGNIFAGPESGLKVKAFDGDGNELAWGGVISGYIDGGTLVAVKIVTEAPADKMTLTLSQITLDLESDIITIQPSLGELVLF